jgi:hypothetical protein
VLMSYEMQETSVTGLEGKRVLEEYRLLEYHNTASFVYSLTLKMDAMRSSEIPVNFCQTTWSHIPEDYTLRSHRRKNSDLTCTCENLVIMNKDK